MPDQTSLLNEIKLLLQEELADVRNSIHGIEVQMTEIKGRSIERMEFESAMEREREKREALEQRTNELDKEVAAMRTSTKIYIGLASAIASLVASGVAGIIFSML